MTDEKQETVTPTSGGLLSNSDIGAAFKLNIPANALGTGSNAGTVKTQVNTAVPSPVTGTVLSNNAISISAVDSSGSPIKNLNTPVTVVVPYTDTGLTAAQESNLSLGVWNDAAQSYDVLSSTVDTSANTLTAAVSHFSDFAPLSSEGVASPSPAPAPAPSPAPSGGGVVSLALLNPGSPVPAPVLAQVTPVAPSPVSTTPVITSGPTLTQTLKVGSTNKEVSVLQQYLIDKGFLVMPAGVSLGYFGQVTRSALMAYQTSVGLSAVGELGPMTRAAILSGCHAQAAPTGNAIGLYNFVLPLKQGSKGTDVIKLQEILIAKGFLVMPVGVSKGYYGALTTKAVQAYQKSLGLDQLGIVGPATRKALNSAQ
jgi:peptidoglycan hydrolase-like protein with peptidoglycan-binding domain